MSERHAVALVIDVDDLLDLLACVSGVPDGARTVGLLVASFRTLEITIEHPGLEPLPPRTAPWHRNLDCRRLKEQLMEKQGVIKPGLTPPEEGQKAEKQAGAEGLEAHVTKRAADAAERSFGRGRPEDKKAE